MGGTGDPREGIRSKGRAYVRMTVLKYVRTYLGAYVRAYLRTPETKLPIHSTFLTTSLEPHHQPTRMSAGAAVLVIWYHLVPGMVPLVPWYLNNFITNLSNYLFIYMTISHLRVYYLRLSVASALEHMT